MGKEPAHQIGEKAEFLSIYTTFFFFAAFLPCRGSNPLAPTISFHQIFSLLESVLGETLAPVSLSSKIDDGILCNEKTERIVRESPEALTHGLTRIDVTVLVIGP